MFLISLMVIGVVNGPGKSNKDNISNIIFVLKSQVNNMKVNYGIFNSTIDCTKHDIAELQKRGIDTAEEFRCVGQCTSSLNLKP